MVKKIFVDAGHNYSGFNTGAVGNGMREQDIAFDVAFALSRILEGAGFEVRLSRPTLQTNLGVDNASAINARWQMSNAWGADLFVSVHANAGGGTGAEVLYGKDDSEKFARVVQDVYSAAMGLRNRRVWRRNDVGVVRNANCPAILVETAFIDAPAGSPDVDILRNRRPEMARAIADGIFEYLGVPLSAQGGGDSPEERGTVPFVPDAQPQRFGRVDEMPVWARGTIEKLIRLGHLKGDGTGLDLSLDMIRIFVVHDMAGLY